MSRIAKAPVKIPAGVEIKTDGGVLTVKSAKATLTKAMPAGVAIEVNKGVANLSADSVKANAAMAGTFRALLSNMVNGVVKPYTTVHLHFEIRLDVAETIDGQLRPKNTFVSPYQALVASYQRKMAGSGCTTSNW